MLICKIGKEWTAVLKEWLANKDRDLRECEGHAEVRAGVRGKKVTSMGALEENRVLKQLHVNQSIDHALKSRSWQSGTCRTSHP
jgi:hypothetical protein